MPRELENEEKVPKSENKVFAGNTISLHIDRIAGLAQDANKKKQLKAAICLAVAWGPIKLARVLNNHDQPALEQLTEIADLLQVPIDDLVKRNHATLGA